MLSGRIIGFIANLPHFQNDTINDLYVATRLTDGTVYLPPPEEEAQERGLIIARWQGDIKKQTTTLGAQIAGLEIVEAVRYWIATGEEKNMQESVKFVFDHFKYKTGENVCGRAEGDSILEKIMEHLVKELGTGVIKKLIGM